MTLCVFVITNGSIPCIRKSMMDLCRKNTLKEEYNIIKLQVNINQLINNIISLFLLSTYLISYSHKITNKIIPTLELALNNF
jgi:hypothetical protein